MIATNYTNVTGTITTKGLGLSMVQSGLEIEQNGNVKICASEPYKNLISDKILFYKILSPNKVISVKFEDGNEKVVCEDCDTFDLRTGLYIAIAKHLYKGEYTIEGIEYKAKEISMKKKYVDMVEKAIKTHDKLEKMEKEFIEQNKKEKQIAHEKRVKTAMKKRERKIELQKEAYLRAMQEFAKEKGE